MSHVLRDIPLDRWAGQGVQSMVEDHESLRLTFSSSRRAERSWDDVLGTLLERFGHAFGMAAGA